MKTITTVSYSILYNCYNMYNIASLILYTQAACILTLSLILTSVGELIVNCAIGGRAQLHLDLKNAH